MYNENKHPTSRMSGKSGGNAKITRTINCEVGD